MDAISYSSYGFGGTSSYSSGAKTYTDGIFSNVNLSNISDGNGAYTGSNIQISIQGTLPGIYQVVPTIGALVGADPSTKPVFVQVGMGSAAASASAYTATAGQVTVTIDSSGTYHYSSGGIAMARTDSLAFNGGIPGAPATMTLKIVDLTK